VNGDHHVGVNVLVGMVQAWGKQGSPGNGGGSNVYGDMNNDGYVNVGDLQLLVAAWGSSAGGSWANWNPNADLNGTTRSASPICS
jgi:hypothetical protein